MMKAKKPGYRRMDIGPSAEDRAMLTNVFGDVLEKRELCDAYFLLWDARSVTPFHHHGNSEGLIQVVSGTLFEERYSMKTKELFGQRAVGSAGKTFLELPQFIQRMGNMGDEKALSLHVFLKGPMKMEEFDPKLFLQAPPLPWM
ncbi:MAG: hypothetical protein Q7R85_03645 [bacterium]|nr:hypothetical protein [bacterium]